jgi:hypothetical protein
MSTETMDTQSTAICREITGVDTYGQMVAHAEGIVEQLDTLMQIIGREILLAGEAYAGADVGSTAMSTAITHLGEANGRGEQLDEALDELLAAMPELHAQGDKATELGAAGSVDSFAKK